MPGGQRFTSNGLMFWEVVALCGMGFIYWSVDAEDWHMDYEFYLTLLLSPASVVDVIEWEPSFCLCVCL